MRAPGSTLAGDPLGIVICGFEDVSFAAPFASRRAGWRVGAGVGRDRERLNARWRVMPVLTLRPARSGPDRPPKKQQGAKLRKERNGKNRRGDDRDAIIKWSRRLSEYF